MRQYLELMDHVLAPWRGKARPHRHRHIVGVRSSDARSICATAFRCVTTKKLHLKSIIYELLWFLRATPTSNISTSNGVRIWDEWADENGDLGPVYGRQWRSWPARDGGTIDQIANLLRDDRAQSGFAAADRHGLESGGCRQDGAAAVPLPVPVLRREGQALLPALSALGRHLPRRAVQHRLLCAADDDGGAGDRAASRANSFTPSATRISISIMSSRRICNCRARRARLPVMRINPAVKDLFALPLRGFHARRLRAASAHQGRRSRCERTCERIRRDA